IERFILFVCCTREWISGFSSRMVCLCLCSCPFALTLTLTLIPVPALHANSSRTPITDSLWRATKPTHRYPGASTFGLTPGYKHSAPLGLVLSSLSHPFGLAVPLRSRTPLWAGCLPLHLPLQLV